MTQLAAMESGRRTLDSAIGSATGAAFDCSSVTPLPFPLGGAIAAVLPVEAVREALALPEPNARSRLISPPPPLLLASLVGVASPAAAGVVGVALNPAGADVS